MGLEKEKSANYSHATEEKQNLPAEMQRSSGGSTEDLARKYLKQLSKGMLGRLQARYQVDFDAFGYDPYEYVEGRTRKVSHSGNNGTVTERAMTDSTTKKAA